MKLWTDIATAAGVELSAEQIRRLDAYLDGLIETNKTLNLTRIVDRQDAAVKHVADALTLLNYLPAVGTPSSPPPLAGGGGGRGFERGPAVNRRMTGVAKKLRHDMTVPERFLWSRLRTRPNEIKFRRQQPIGRYVADFYCSDQRLVIELDGRSHDSTTADDAQRQAWLESQGIRVLRFLNDDVLQNPDAVVETILQACAAEPLPPPPPARGGGEERRQLSLSAPSLTLADVGTGGGIPGVILAIARPDIAVTLIDSTAKKLAAVQSICDRIGLTNVTTLHARIEQTPRRFDVVTARGVAELTKLLTWCRGLMKPSSVLLAMKGPRVAEEMANLTPAQRKQFNFEQHDVTVPELSGHVVVRATLKV